ncbi:MAG: transposase [Oligoflexia bacterium]|nr:transposase [Oligoflexia bacterium]
MTKNDEQVPPHKRWAEFRFSVVGGLLASPPNKGDLKVEIEKLCQKNWKHPISGEISRFGFSTIENWYYQSRREKMYPLEALRSKVRSDMGTFKRIDQKIKDYLKKQYQNHKSWSAQLHRDNVVAVFGDTAPSYATTRRFLKREGLLKKKKFKKKFGMPEMTDQFQKKETRSFENGYVNGLWHADYHHCSRQVVTKDGHWRTPVVLAILDDHSRLCCHAQWYLDENTQNLVHTFNQALLKRSMPRSFLSDNGSAFVSKEFTQGLSRLGIQIDNTLPLHPEQNGKQERFFSTLEGWLMDLIENKKEITLKELNDYTLVWLEMEYNRSKHKEIECAPLERFANNKNVGRPSPTFKELQLFFCREESRLQRHTDGTISLKANRYEISSCYRTLDVI